MWSSRAIRLKRHGYSADFRHPDGLANSSGLVGRNLMVQANQAVYGTMEDEIRWYKGPPSLAITESEIVPVMIMAIKELAARVEALEHR